MAIADSKSNKTVDLRGLVISELLPAQEFTHARMSELKRAFKD